MGRCMFDTSFALFERKHLVRAEPWQSSDETALSFWLSLDEIAVSSKPCEGTVQSKYSGSDQAKEAPRARPSIGAELERNISCSNEILQCSNRNVSVRTKFTDRPAGRPAGLRVWFEQKQFGSSTKVFRSSTGCVVRALRELEDARSTNPSQGSNGNN